ncbi:hypothetical protein [Candidatus Sororendozoicomonas aggregata]|uniref:hypothetical protein n=1 Tax=Candidatus Sororendozoicomonas aggregata TaxID=3073239 RepID=UPI002ED42A55
MYKRVMGEDNYGALCGSNTVVIVVQEEICHEVIQIISSNYRNDYDNLNVNSRIKSSADTAVCDKRVQKAGFVG